MRIKRTKWAHIGSDYQTMAVYVYVPGHGRLGFNIYKRDNENLTGKRYRTRLKMAFDMLRDQLAEVI
jgi:hypothetical protein